MSLLYVNRYQQNCCYFREPCAMVKDQTKQTVSYISGSWQSNSTAIRYSSFLVSSSLFVAFPDIMNFEMTN
jgi:hypothetical protein